MKNFIRRGRANCKRAISALQFAAPTLTRLLIGAAFLFTGWGKLMNLDRTIAFFTGLGIPFPAANGVFISSLELMGGACLLLGLGTRIFATLLSSTMLVALLTADRATLVSKFPADLTDVTPVVFLLFLIWLILYGAGPVSVDRLLARRFA
jgi:putative oxidoreductase